MSNADLTPLLIRLTSSRQPALSTAEALRFESLPHARPFLGPHQFCDATTYLLLILHFYQLLHLQHNTRAMPPTRPSTATATPPYPSSRPGSSRPDSPAKSATANSSLILRKQLMGMYDATRATGGRSR